MKHPVFAIIAFCAILSTAFATAAQNSAGKEIPISQRPARVSPAWITDGIMYQIQPRAFTREGTLKAAKAQLPQLAKLGVTILYLCPIFVADDDMDHKGWSARQKKADLNNPRNPYRIKDYFNVDPEYGTNQDLKDFVGEAHRLGLKVMLDLVYMHCGPNAVFIKDHPNFVQRDANGAMKLTIYNFPKIEFNNPELREYLWSNMEFLLKEFCVDGFRCDVADSIPLSFWEESRDRLQSLRPDLGMLAEGKREADQLKAFDLDYSYSAFRAWDNADAMRKSWVSLRSKRPKGGAKFVRFMENHDIANDSYAERLEKKWGTLRVEAVLVSIFSFDGVPFVYNGQEVADAARHSIFGRLTVDWANGNTKAGRDRFEFCQRLCALRKAEKALTRGSLEWVDSSDPMKVLSILREYDGEQILTVVNLGNEPVRVELKSVGDGKFSALLSRAVSGDAQSGFSLEPHGFFVGKRSTLAR